MKRNEGKHRRKFGSTFVGQTLVRKSASFLPNSLKKASVGLGKGFTLSSSTGWPESF